MSGRVLVPALCFSSSFLSLSLLPYSHSLTTYRTQHSMYRCTSTIETSSELHTFTHTKRQHATYALARSEGMRDQTRTERFDAVKSVFYPSPSARVAAASERRPYTEPIEHVSEDGLNREGHRQRGCTGETQHKNNSLERTDGERFGEKSAPCFSRCR